MEWPTDVGLGLENDELRLDRTSQAWIDAGTRLRDNVAGRLAGSVVGVEQIGSSSVLTLLAKRRAPRLVAGRPDWPHLRGRDQPSAEHLGVAIFDGIPRGPCEDGRRRPQIGQVGTAGRRMWQMSSVVQSAGSSARPRSTS